MNDHNRHDKLTSDGDLAFITNCFIPMNRNNVLFMEQLRALWTALCLHNGVTHEILGDDYTAGLKAVEDALGRSDEKFERFMSELLILDEIGDGEDE